MPGFDELAKSTIGFLKKRLERANRSSRAHFWRGLLCLLVLVPIAFALGWLVNLIALWHATTATLSVAILAQVLATKRTWKTSETMAKSADSAERRRAVETLFTAFSHSLMPSLVLFLVGGFTLLFVFRLALAAHDLSVASSKGSAFLRPFVSLQRVLAAPGELLAILFALFASVLMPQAYVAQSLKTILKTKNKLKDGTLAVVAGGFTLSLRAIKPGTQSEWIGPNNGTAKIDAAACKHALIVALVAFAVSIAFLLVLLVAAAK